MNPKRGKTRAIWRTVDGVDEKRCPVCGKWLPADKTHFYHKRDTLLACRPCSRATAREYQRDRYVPGSRAKGGTMTAARAALAAPAQGEPQDYDALIARLHKIKAAGSGWGMPILDGESIDVTAGNAADAIAALRAENAVAMRERNDAIAASMHDMTAKQRAEAECEKLRADAERYRWLRDEAPSDWIGWADERDAAEATAPEVDAAIDKARNVQPGEQERSSVGRTDVVAGSNPAALVSPDLSAIAALRDRVERQSLLLNTAIEANKPLVARAERAEAELHQVRCERDEARACITTSAETIAALRAELHNAKADRNTYDAAHKRQAAATLRAEAERDSLRAQKASLQDSLERETALVIKYGDRAERAEAECEKLREQLEGRK